MAESYSGDERRLTVVEKWLHISSLQGTSVYGTNSKKEIFKNTIQISKQLQRKSISTMWGYI